MRFVRRTPLTRTERIAFRFGGVGFGFSLGRIAQELIIELFYPSRGSTEPNIIRLLPVLARGSAAMTPETALALLYVPVMVTGLIAAGAQLLTYRFFLQERTPSGRILVNTAVLASVAHALCLWPLHLVTGETLPFVLSAAAVGAAGSIVIAASWAAQQRGGKRP